MSRSDRIPTTRRSGPKMSSAPILCFASVWMAVFTVAVGSIEIRSPRLADRIALTVMVASLPSSSTQRKTGRLYNDSLRFRVPSVRWAVPASGNRYSRSRGILIAEDAGAWNAALATLHRFAGAALPTPKHPFLAVKACPRPPLPGSMRAVRAVWDRTEQMQRGGRGTRQYALARRWLARPRACRWIPLRTASSRRTISAEMPGRADPVNSTSVARPGPDEQFLDPAIAQADRHAGMRSAWLHPSLRRSPLMHQSSVAAPRNALPNGLRPRRRLRWP